MQGIEQTDHQKNGQYDHGHQAAGVSDDPFPGGPQVFVSQYRPAVNQSGQKQNGNQGIGPEYDWFE